MKLRVKTLITVIGPYVLLLIVSGFFRLLYLNLIEFQADQAVSFLQTVLFFHQPHLILTGMVSSLGVQNFPLFNYLLVLLGLFSKDPQGLSFLIAAVNVLTIELFYFVAAKFYSLKVALYAALILATSPWLIYHSRQIWAQDFVLLFLVPIVFFLHKVLLEKKQGKSYFFLFFFLGLLTQLHLSGLFLSAAIFITLLVKKMSINYKTVLAGVLTSLLFAIPYFWHEVTANPICPDCRAFLTYQAFPKIFDPANILRPFQLLNGSFFQLIIANDYGNFLKTFPFVIFLNQIFDVSSVTLYVSLLLIFLHRRKNIFIPLTIIFVAGLYFVTKTDSWPHYYLIIAPFLALAMGLGMEIILGFVTSKFLKIGVLIIFVSFILANLSFESYFNEYLSVHKGFNGFYGPVFPVTKRAAEEKTAGYSGLPNYEIIKSVAYYFQVKRTVNLARDIVKVEKGYPEEVNIVEQIYSIGKK